jgi:carbon-monoxide dehydrogenase large subunit
MTSLAEGQKYVGNGLQRKEDPALITGEGIYTDDLKLPGMLYFVMVRSPMAHARITSVDKSAAEQMPGVVAVYSGQDLASEWAAGLPCAWPLSTEVNYPTPSNLDPRLPNHWPVAQDEVRFAGDPVAVVLADTREHAVDAAEMVDVEYDELPVVTDMEKALEPGAPLVHEELGTNEVYTWRFKHGEDTDQIFAEAPVTIKERYVQPRLIPNAIEPRAVVVQPTPVQGGITMWTSTQIPHFVKIFMAVVCGIPETKIRVITPNVGGGFGAKLDIYAEEPIAVVLARKHGVPVKWTEERSENYLSTIHGRAQVQYMELAATEDGELLGVRAKVIADMGAYLQLLTPGIPILGAQLYSGKYKARGYSFECTGALTNLVPTDAYRGAGRPEACYAIERAMDTLARRVGKDPAEIRMLNFMPPFTEPTEAVNGLHYDSGDYPALLEEAMRMVDYEGLRSEQAERRARGDLKQLGIGLSTYIEICGFAPSQVVGGLQYAGGGWDSATLRCHPTGKVEAIVGVSPHGQGHETTFSQIVADELGVAFEDVEVLHGDTAISHKGLDTYGSRSLSVGGVAIHYAAEKVRAKARTLAAHELEVAEEDLEWVDGKFQVKGAPDKTRTIPQIAWNAWTAHDIPKGFEPYLEGDHSFDPPNWTYPTGAHICVVEVDTETGQTYVRRYVAVDDCGNIINPVIVQGQVHGGIAQGLAEGQFEEAIFDENGVLLTGSMANYRIPAASEMPSFETAHQVTPSTTNPLGVKGIGEAGTIASPPAFINAVIDALSPLGVTAIDKPANPERIWRAISAAADQAAPESTITGGIGGGSGPTQPPGATPTVAGSERPTGEGSVQ